MAIEDDFIKFAQRYQSVVEQRDRSDQLIKDLLLYIRGQDTRLADENARLQQQLAICNAELDSSRVLNADLRQRTQLCEDANPYVLVLIDGDGLIFNDEYIRQGVEGGRKAAHALRNSLLQKCGDFADKIEIVANVYANVSGLSRALIREGTGLSENDLKNFSIGFSQGRASFGFIDIGHGKERADVKIQELTKWHLKNKNCKHILLGISHDSGYASFLDHIITDEDTRSVMSIIEGVPIVRELRQKDVNIVHFDHIFRSEKITDRGAQAPISSRSATPVQAPSMTSTTSSTSSNAPSTPPTTWAAVTSKVTPPPQITLPLAHMNINNNVARPPSSIVPKLAILTWEPGPRGIDPIITCNQNILDTIKKRKDTAKLCNNHYLRGPCAKGSECCFEHKYKPSDEEKKAIAFLARQNPCTKGQDCDVANCIYGHHCPSVRDGTCTHPYCKFRVEEHPPGTKFKNVHIKDN